MSEYPRTDKNRIKQVPQRAAYDEQSVHSILDEGYIGHIAFEYEDTPQIIPIYYIRDGHSILIHGSRKARIFRHLAKGAPLSFAVTHLDALVLARSAFHHSMNYRSVIIHSRAAPLEGGEKARALDLFVERLEKGRASKARRTNASEDKATMVLAIPIENVSAKQRSGGPVDDKDDMSLDIWAGIIPLTLQHGKPQRGDTP